MQATSNMYGSAQDRPHQPGQAAPEAEPERPLVEFPGRDAAAEREVLAQHGLDSGRERSVRHHDRQLEVEAERAVVEIGGADGNDVIVHQKHLLVKEARLVAVDHDASGLRPRVVAITSQLKKTLDRTDK